MSTEPPFRADEARLSSLVMQALEELKYDRDTGLAAIPLADLWACSLLKAEATLDPHILSRLKLYYTEGVPCYGLECGSFLRRRTWGIGHFKGQTMLHVNLGPTHVLEAFRSRASAFIAVPRHIWRIGLGPVNNLIIADGDDNVSVPADTTADAFTFSLLRQVLGL